MTNREKVIIIITLIVFCYGIFYLLSNFTFSNSKTEKFDLEKEKKQLQEFVTNVTINATKSNISESDKYILDLIIAQNIDNPFLKSDTDFYLDTKNSKGDNSIQLVYSGFLKVGETVMAIINGMEYRIFNKIEGTDFFVKTISPVKVELSNNVGKIYTIALKNEEIQAQDSQPFDRPGYNKKNDQNAKMLNKLQDMAEKAMVP